MPQFNFMDIPFNRNVNVPEAEFFLRPFRKQLSFIPSYATGGKFIKLT